VLQLPDGTIREVTDDELHRLGLVDRQEASKRFSHALARGIGAGDHWVETEELASPLNTIMHMADCAINYDHDFDSDGDEHTREIIAELTALNRQLLESVTTTGAAATVCQ